MYPELNKVGVFKILTGKPTGKEPVGRPRHRLHNNFEIELKEIGINVRICN